MSSRIHALVILLIIMRGQAGCQSANQPSGDPAEASMMASSVADTARLIGVISEIEKLRLEQQPTPADSPQQWRRLWLHQRIYERVTIVQLQADATIASIDNEIARSTEVHGYLADKRDRKVTRANLLSALFGGGLGASSAGLQLSSKLTNATVATGIAGGAISAGLAVYGIHAQRGGTRTLDTDSNMLAEFFGRPELPTSHYPRIIWQFLNEVAPTDPDHLIRRERLIRTWLELNRLDSLATPSGRLKIEHVTSMPDQHLTLTIDDLEDRIAMLQDVRAKLSYLKRDLAALLASLPELYTPDETSPTTR
jgi:hypothetical protein